MAKIARTVRRRVLVLHGPNLNLCFQSNLEGELIERIQRAAGEGIGFPVFNPAAYTHTSVAVGTIGLGSRGYDFALAHALGKLDGPAQA